MNPIQRSTVPFQQAPKPWDQVKNQKVEIEKRELVLPFTKEELNTAPGKPVESPRATFTSTADSLKRLAR